VRVRLTLCGLLAATALASCGTGGDADVTPGESPTLTTEISTGSAAAGCVLSVYISREATKDQVAAVRARLAGDDAIAHFRFVTREDAWAEMKASFPPELLESLGPNPPIGIVDRFRVTPHDADDSHRLVQEYRAAKLAGVQHVAYQRRGNSCL
jgi:cell division protein FtsX